MARRYQNLSSDQIMREQRAERELAEGHARTRAELERVGHKLPLFQLAPGEPLCDDTTPAAYTARKKGKTR